MTNKQNQKTENCIYCNLNKATTIDHIPSQGLFPDTTEVNFVKVPACRDCNASFSLDEEFLRNFICNFGMGKSPDADKLFEKIKRATQRRPGLAIQQFKKMSLVDAYSPAGIYLGQKTRIDIDDEDRRRIFNVITKYTKGLFFNHLGVVLPEDYRVKVVWLTNDSARATSNIIGKIKLIDKFSDVFAYGYSKVPDNYNSVWLLTFFEQLAFLVFVSNLDFSHPRR